MTEHYYLFDGDRWWELESLEDAMDGAAEAIENARDCCDPEWPCWASEIAIYAAFPGCDEPDEDGRLIAYAKEVEIPTPDGMEDADADYWCDYVMREVGE